MEFATSKLVSDRLNGVTPMENITHDLLDVLIPDPDLVPDPIPMLDPVPVPR
jgi:hypothetical protein